MEPAEKKSKLEENGARAGAVANGNAWCCSFAGAPDSPDLRPLPPSSTAAAVASPAAGRKLPPKSLSTPSFHSQAGGPRRAHRPVPHPLTGPRLPIDPDGVVLPPLPLPLPPSPPTVAPPAPTENAAVIVVPAGAGLSSMGREWPPASRRSGGAAASLCGDARERGRRIRRHEGAGVADPAGASVEEGGSGGGSVGSDARGSGGGARERGRTVRMWVRG
ncbi:SH3 domain-containing protein C23A1.17-like [Setaria italica]|uniref:SH3 domain-containing protein C23A1.17-like n=1 Tax=Setaria italica TaxID=4555 RepID=UPI000647403D|nr:SH3 domain-containing protein C23A1.17-like [Setaria italica]